MRVGIIGGVDRSKEHFEQIAKQAGHELECHDGHVVGRAGSALDAMIDRSDLVIIVTDVNSHNAVTYARRAMRARGRTPMLTRRLGSARFAALLLGLADEAAFGGAR